MLDNDTLDSTPAQLVFCHDVIFDTKTLINLEGLSIKKKFQLSIDESTLQEKLRFGFMTKYIVCDKPYQKLDGPNIEPYCIFGRLLSSEVYIHDNSPHLYLSIYYPIYLGWAQ